MVVMIVIVLVIGIGVKDVMLLDSLLLLSHLFGVSTLKFMIIKRMDPNGTRRFGQGIDEKVVLSRGVELTNPSMGQRSKSVFERFTGGRSLIVRDG